MGTATELPEALGLGAVAAPYSYCFSHVGCEVEREHGEAKSLAQSYTMSQGQIGGTHQAGSPASGRIPSRSGRYGEKRLSGDW